MTNLVWSQYCPSLGPDQYLPCGVGSTTLTADLSQCGAGQNPNQTTNYSVSNVGYNPDPYTSGTIVSLGDDAISTAIPIGFNFCYFGQTYNTFYIGSNNWIGFSAGQTSTWMTTPIPNNAGTAPMNCIMGPWQDINPGIGGTIRWTVYGTAPCRRLVISYYQIPMFSCTNQLYSSQIKIYETTNVIETHIQNKPICSSWNSGNAVHGLHNANGTVAVLVQPPVSASIRNNNQWSTQNEGIRFTPSGPVVAPTLTWYQVGNPNPIGTGQTITVTPPQPGAYYTCHFVYPICNAGWTTCNANVGFGPDTVFVQPGPPNLPQPIINFTDPTCNLSCDGTIDVTPQGGNGVQTISWNGPEPPQFNQVGLCSGVYSFTITDAAGCTVTSNVTLTDPSVPVVSTINSSDTVCIYSTNETLLVTQNPGWTYQWTSNGVILSGNGTSQIDVDFSNLPSNQWYTTSVIGYNASGCPSLPVTTSTFTLEVIPVITQIGPFCIYDNCQTLSATPLGGQFSGLGVNVDQFCPQSAQLLTQVDYTYNQSGCQFIGISNIVVNPRPEITDINPDNGVFQICDIDSALVDLQITTNLSPTTNYWIISGDTIESLSYTGNFPEGMTTINIFVESSEGCISNNETTTVNVIKCPEVIYYVPNAFTPDGDEHNQEFSVVFTAGFDPSDFHLEIWNRWGELIWESYDHTAKWDGTYGGNICQSGIYLWKIRFGNEDDDGSQLLYGHLNVLR